MFADGAFAEGSFADVRRVIVASGIQVALTGQAVTVSTGSLSPATSASITGQAISVSQGALSKSIVRAVTGQALAITQGVVTPSSVITVQLTGQFASFATGTLTPGAGQAPAPFTLGGLHIRHGVNKYSIDGIDD